MANFRYDVKRVFTLTEINSCRISSNFNAKKILQYTQVFHMKTSAKVEFKALDGRRSIAGND
jgi:hypothetical protein